MDELRPIVLYADGKEIASGNRIRVRGSGNMTLLPDFYMIDIYNLSSEDRATVSNATYISASAVGKTYLCYGEVDDIYTRIEGVNTVTTVSITDGKTFWGTKINQTVGGGAGIRDAMSLIMKGASLGAYLAQDRAFPRGQVYRGRLAENVSMLAKSAGAWAFITKNVVYVVTNGKAADIIEIPDNDIVSTTSYANGVTILKTLVKGYPIGVIARAQGRLYRLVSQKISADNFKGEWSSDVVLANEDSIEMEGG